MRRLSLLIGMLALGCDGEPIGGGQQGTLDAQAATDASADARHPDAQPVDARPPTDTGAPDAAPDALVDAALDAAPPEPDLGPPPPAEGLPRFAFPILHADRALMLDTPIFGVDHDPAEGQRAVCTNYAGRGFPLCYDGHDGSDFVLRGGFTTMDRGSAQVVAAAGGVVIEAEDGHYDRCHASAAQVDVSCDGHPVIGNRVKLRHAGGWESWYWHLKEGSVAVAVGDEVTCGTVLGRVGSSGYSSLPHLHFEVRQPDGPWIDPFAGPASQPESLWAEQVGSAGLPGDVCDRAWGAIPP